LRGATNFNTSLAQYILIHLDLYCSGSQGWPQEKENCYYFWQYGFSRR